MTSAVRRAVKRGLDACCLVLVAPCAAMCAVEAARNAHAETFFTFWAQAFACVPGLPGVFVRRAFYRLTLDKCASSCSIGFGALFSHRRSTVEQDVYVGPYAIVGSSRLGRGCLIGSRASILSGGGLHTLGDDMRWTPTDVSRLRQIDIGEHAWIGEACVIIADVGRSAMVAAGSVVASAVPPGIMVAGNPSRFVRRLTDAPQEVPPVKTSVSIR